MIRSKSRQQTVYVPSSHIIAKIPINRISSIGFKKIGFSAAASTDQTTGITIIISIVRRFRLAAVKHAVYHFHAVNANPMRLYEISSAAMMCAVKQM